MPLSLRNLKLDLDGKYARAALWAVSLTTATSAYYTLKSTHLYHYYHLHLYDRPPLVPVTILLLLLVLAFSTRSGYIIDLRRNQRNLPAVATSRMLEFILFGFYWRNRDLMNDAETMVLATTLALFILCFLRAVAPGFGHNLPTIALFAAAGISFQISQVWSHMPYIGAVVVAKRIFQDYDEGLLNNLL